MPGLSRCPCIMHASAGARSHERGAAAGGKQRQQGSRAGARCSDCVITHLPALLPEGGFLKELERAALLLAGAVVPEDPPLRTAKATPPATATAAAATAAMTGAAEPPFFLSCVAGMLPYWCSIKSDGGCRGYEGGMNLPWTK